ncbi:MAG: GC-type dockerin domain-anchored protein [Planctomycetota bacterium]
MLMHAQNRHLRARRKRATALAGLTALAAVAAAVATDWEEPPGDDAGSLPLAPQSPRPPYDDLFSTKGSLGFDASARPAAAERLQVQVDTEDLYEIIIVDPREFIAQVIEGPSETDFDAQLFLFDRDGFPLLANNDAGTFTTAARLTAQANDQTEFRLTQPGIYLIGISGAGNIPLATATGSFIPMFSPAVLPPGEVSGPDGPGANFPLGAWSGDGEVGRYLIAFEGVRTPPGPCPADVTTNGANPGHPAFGQPDGLVTTTDLTFFIEAWINGAARADITTDGTVPGDARYEIPDLNITVADLSRFVELWLAGCTPESAPALD